jgi:hypothetical protein
MLTFPQMLNECNPIFHQVTVEGILAYQAKMSPHKANSPNKVGT